LKATTSRGALVLEANEVGYLFAATTCDAVNAAEFTKRLKRRANDVVSIGGVEALRQNVVDACALENCAYRTTGDNARPWRSWLQKHAASAELAVNFVWNRDAVEWDLEHALASLVVALADRFGNFVGFAETDTNVTGLVAYNDKRSKRKASSALHNLRNAVDVDDAFLEFLFFDFDRHDFLCVLRHPSTVRADKCA
jgi:hypothetical protein